LYEPLFDTPHLFLEFARLVEAKKPYLVLQEWIHERGLLGLHGGSAGGTTGGSEERLSAQWDHAERAGNLLATYEAAVSNDMEKLRRVFESPHQPGVAPLLFKELEDRVDLTEVVGEDEAHRTLSLRLRETAGEDEGRRAIRDVNELKDICLHGSLSDPKNVDYLTAVAMRIVMERVQDTLASLVRPTFATMADSSDGTFPERWWDPDLLTRSWAPINLLGAMYLQFYWLITSRGDLSRCKYCGDVLDNATPIARHGKKARKPRSDREFCDPEEKPCKQNYHYHNKIKPARDGNNKSGDRSLP
jgi:hypothetical protein